MLNSIPLKCPNCGANLNIAPEMTTFACGYCGASQMVERSGGTVSLKLLDAISKVQYGTDRTAAELALKRLQEEANQVGLHLNNLRGAKLRAMFDHSKIYKRYALFLVVICFCLCFFHIALTILSIITCCVGLYFIYTTYGKKKNEIIDYYEVLMDAQHQQGAAIQQRIDKNWQIANS